MHTIIESLIEHAPTLKSAADLIGHVRVALRKSIIQSISGPNEDLNVLVLEPQLEQMIAQSQHSMGQDSLAIDPSLAETLSERIDQAAQLQQKLGQTPTLLVPDVLRSPVARLMRRPAPSLRVIAHSEVPESKPIKISKVVSAA